jgi:hypothetical protein
MPHHLQVLTFFELDTVALQVNPTMSCGGVGTAK